LKIFQDIKDRHNEGTALGNLANSHSALRESGIALRYYTESLEIARETDDRRGEANALFNSGLQIYKQGEPAKAIEQAIISLKIYEDLETQMRKSFVSIGQMVNSK